MDTAIQVTMFGKFTIFGPGLIRPRVVNLNGRSKRLWSLVAYLIIHRDRGVPAEELIELFWHNSEGLNLMSTLQNNISRARNALEDLGLENGKYLIHNNSGTYFWAPAQETVFDCEVFEAKARQALDCPDKAQALELAKEAASLYSADFLPENTGDTWCAGLNAKYHSLYLALCQAAAQWLLDEEKYEEAAAFCAPALELDPAAVELGVLYMRGLNQSGQHDKALAYYERTTEYLRTTYGICRAERLEEERAQAQRSHSGIDRDQVLNFLRWSDRESGALQCNVQVFREMVNRHLRDMPRSKIPAQLLAVQINGGELEQEKLSVYMRQMGQVIQHSLRAGDAFTRKGMELFLVLLPGAEPENGGVIIRRVQDRFRNMYPKSKAQFDYQLLDLAQLGQEWEG